MVPAGNILEESKSTCSAVFGSVDAVVSPFSPDDDPDSEVVSLQAVSAQSPPTAIRAMDGFSFITLTSLRDAGSRCNAKAVTLSLLVSQTMPIDSLRNE